MATLRIGQEVTWQGRPARVLAFALGAGLGDFVGDPPVSAWFVRVYLVPTATERAEVRAVPLREVRP